MGARPWCPGSYLRGPRQQPAPREPHRHHRVIMPTLAEAGTDKKLSSRAQKLAGVPEAVCLGSPRTRETALAGVRGASRRGFVHLWIRGAAVAVKADLELPEEWRDSRLQDRSRQIITTCQNGAKWRKRRQDSQRNGLHKCLLHGRGYGSLESCWPSNRVIPADISIDRYAPTVSCRWT